MDSYEFKHKGAQYKIQDGNILGGPEVIESIRDIPFLRERAACAEILKLAEDLDETCAALGNAREERDALKLTAEEGSEIIAELAAALAVLAGESLILCPSPCPGHFGPKTQQAFTSALATYRALQEGNRQAVERVKEVELLLDTVRERAVDGLQMALLRDLLTDINQHHQEGEGALDTLRRIIREREDYLKGREAALADLRKAEASVQGAIDLRDSWKTFAQKQRARVEPLERENREKCLELAEKAGDIELLQAENERLVQEVADLVGLRTEVQQQRMDRAVIANSLENLLEFTKRDWQRDISRAILAKLLALLDSEEPPDGLLDGIDAMPGMVNTVAAVWRWLREQVVEHHQAPPPPPPEPPAGARRVEP